MKILYFFSSLSIIISCATLHGIKVIHQPSPFHDQRTTSNNKKILKPEYIIIHFTANCGYQSSWKSFFNFLRPVSTHYLIGADGNIVKMVPEAKRAWHAGESYWKGNENMNNSSIGIEIINPGFSQPDQDPCTTNKTLWNKNTGKIVSGSPNLWYEFTPEQIESVIKLCKDIMKRYKIPASNVLGHSDIAPGRKVDPGPLFAWQRLAEHGIGMWWTELQPITDWNITQLQTKLQKIGYKISITGIADTQTTKVVQAFQMHYQQDNISGIADEKTMQILNNLLMQLDLNLTNKSIIL